jgi:hypothetical protein
MPGNPKECRQHALNCQRLAETATNEHDRQQLRALADTWLALAAELESMESLLGTLRQVKSDEQVKPIDEQKEESDEESDHMEPP